MSLVVDWSQWCCSQYKSARHAYRNLCMMFELFSYLLGVSRAFLFNTESTFHLDMYKSIHSPLLKIGKTFINQNHYFCLFQLIKCSFQMLVVVVSCLCINMSSFLHVCLFANVQCCVQFFTIWNSISGFDNLQHFLFEVSCYVVVKVRCHQQIFQEVQDYTGLF